MDIAALECFLAVAESGSFSRAAELQFLTQPAISKRIAALELELGTPLFDRIGRRVHLTEAGRALIPQARQILTQIEDTKRSMLNLSGRMGVYLSLATSHHIGLHRLPEALKQFHTRYPGVELDLRFMDSETACHAVAQGKLEMAVVTLPTQVPQALSSQKIWHDPLEIVVSRDHPLARTKKPEIKQLLQYPAILPGPGTVTRELILSVFKRQRHSISIGMSTNYLEVLKMLTAIGLGWSALPHTMIDAELKVVHIDNIAIHRELGIVTHAKRTLSNAANAMIAIIQQNL